MDSLKLCQPFTRIVAQQLMWYLLYQIIIKLVSNTNIYNILVIK